MGRQSRTVQSTGTPAAVVAGAGVADDVDALYQPLPDHFYVQWSPGEAMKAYALARSRLDEDGVRGSAEQHGVGQHDCDGKSALGEVVYARTPDIAHDKHACE